MKKALLASAIIFGMFVTGCATAQHDKQAYASNGYKCGANGITYYAKARAYTGNMGTSAETDMDAAVIAKRCDTSSPHGIGQAPAPVGDEKITHGTR